MIKRRSDFLAVKSGCSWGTPGFLFQAKFRKTEFDCGAEDNNLGPRFGVTVTKNTVRQLISPAQNKKPGQKRQVKTDLKRGPVSILRNRMRRRLKEALRQIAPDLAQPGIDYVVIGRRACLSVDYEILLKDLEKSFKKVHRRIIQSSTD